MTPEDNFITPFPEIMNMIQSVAHAEKMLHTPSGSTVSSLFGIQSSDAYTKLNKPVHPLTHKYSLFMSLYLQRCQTLHDLVCYVTKSGLIWSNWKVVNKWLVSKILSNQWSEQILVDPWGNCILKLLHMITTTDIICFVMQLLNETTNLTQHCNCCVTGISSTCWQDTHCYFLPCFMHYKAHSHATHIFKWQ
jgi:hypothetical protein